MIGHIALSAIGGEVMNNIQDKIMKTAGIVVDDYKINKFKKELAANNFTVKSTHPFTKGTTTIKVEFEESRKDELQKLCQRLEHFFKNKN